MSLIYLVSDYFLGRNYLILLKNICCCIFWKLKNLLFKKITLIANAIIKAICYSGKNIFMQHSLGISAPDMLVTQNECFCDTRPDG